MRYGVPEQSIPESGKYVTPMAGTAQGSDVKVESMMARVLRTGQVASPQLKVNVPRIEDSI